MWNYSDKVYEHFMNPKNVGEVPDADGVGEVGSMACGDALRLSFKLDDEGKILDAKFQTFGCGSAIASSSVLTEMIKGKTLEEAAKITNELIAEELGGLPREKMHCSVMGREALEAAMIDYYQKQGRELPCHLLSESVIICHCFQVNKDTIREAILTNHLEEIEDVTNFTKAGGGCTDCHHDIEELLRDCWHELEEQGVSRKDQAPRPAPAPVPERSPEEQRLDKIKVILEQDIGVALRNDGGDIELIRVDGHQVYVRLTGTCAACPSSQATIKGYVEAQLREHIGENIEVIEVKS